MRQVPTYLIIGNGRVARHVCQYLTFLDISFVTWSRQESLVQLQKLSTIATHILILISDTEIDRFAQCYLEQSSAIKIHFSGSLVSEHIFGAHPLMSFNNHLYTLDKYKSIPFVIDENAPDFSELLPGLNNRHARISAIHKTKYHALCVLSGNFSVMLWQKLMSGLEQFNLPKTFSNAYLKQITENLLYSAETALTGPLVRNDQITIDKNLLALEEDPFKEVYESFVNCYQKLKETQNECS